MHWVAVLGALFGAGSGWGSYNGFVRLLVWNLAHILLKPSQWSYTEPQTTKPTRSHAFPTITFQYSIVMLIVAVVNLLLVALKVIAVVLAKCLIYSLCISSSGIL